MTEATNYVVAPVKRRYGLGLQLIETEGASPLGDLCVNAGGQPLRKHRFGPHPDNKKALKCKRCGHAKGLTPEPSSKRKRRRR